MKELQLIQSELKAPKAQFNTFGKYKYRSCEDVLEALKPLLKKHNCFVTLSDEINEICGALYITAHATITNSENVSVTVKAQAGIDLNKKGMDIAQTFGSSSSYARKYALNGLFAIDDNKDHDVTSEGNKTKNAVDNLISKIKDCKSTTELKKIWDENPAYQNNNQFYTALTAKKEELQ